MKKSILLLCIASTFSTQSFAWSFHIGGTEVKGDDPKPIPQIVEGIKHLATGASNAVRDAVAAVGNATGISNIIDSNKKVFVDIGSGYACLVTLCYSEVVKKKQLEEVEKEAQDQMNRKILESNSFYNRFFRENAIKENESVVRLAGGLLENQTAQLELLKKEKQINAMTLKALNTQIIWNDAMVRQGVKNRPALSSKIMNQPAHSFEENFNRDFDGAVAELNNAIDQLEVSQKRARQELMSEFVYQLSDSTLRNFTSVLEEQQKGIQAELVDLESSIRVNQAKRQTALSKLAQFKAP